MEENIYDFSKIHKVADTVDRLKRRPEEIGSLLSRSQL
jgi:hypothetical protein